MWLTHREAVQNWHICRDLRRQVKHVLGSSRSCHHREWCHLVLIDKAKSNIFSIIKSTLLLYVASFSSATMGQKWTCTSLPCESRAFLFLALSQCRCELRAWSNVTKKHQVGWHENTYVSLHSRFALHGRPQQHEQRILCYTLEAFFCSSLDTSCSRAWRAWISFRRLSISNSILCYLHFDIFEKVKVERTRTTQRCCQHALFAL
jgi:hypothetical protein